MKNLYNGKLDDCESCVGKHVPVAWYCRLEGLRITTEAQCEWSVTRLRLNRVPP